MLYLVKYSLLGKVSQISSEEELTLGTQHIALIQNEKYLVNILSKSESPSNNYVNENKILRRVTESDIAHYEVHFRKGLHYRAIINDFIRSNSIVCRIVAVEPLFDVRKNIFYFKAGEMSQFKELVKFTANLTKTQVEFRQVEGREEAKVVSDIGACGQQTCCTRFLLETPTIKHEEIRGLWHNNEASLGMCGRIKCCALFEKDCSTGCISCKK